MTAPCARQQFQTRINPLSVFPSVVAMRDFFPVLAVVLSFMLLVSLSGCSDGSPQAKTPAGPATTSPQIGNLAATPSELEHFTSGQPGYADFSAMISGGTPPYSCSLAADSALPSGLELGGECAISGTRTLAPGTPSEISPPFTVLVTDSSQPALGTALKLSVTTDVEKPAFVLVIGRCTEGEQCDTQVATATGGTEPYTFSSGSYAPGSGGAPPAGMTLGIDGRLTGTPAKAGAFRFSACVRDSTGLSDCGETQVVVEHAPAKFPCYDKGIEPQQYAGQPVCCQKHTWCNGPDNCCVENGCFCWSG